MVTKRITGKIACVLLAFLTLSLISLEKAEAENITFRYVVVNPSSVKTQEIEIKKYLPEEVKPGDIVDLGGLQLEYDTERSLYYVFRESIQKFNRWFSIGNCSSGSFVGEKCFR